MAPGKEIALPADIKRINRRKMLGVIRTGKPVTALEISEATGISRLTVMRALQDYCDRGVLRSEGLGGSTSQGGKKPELFRFADERRLLCICLWPETVTLSLCGLCGDVYALEAFPSEDYGILSKALDHLKSYISSYLSSHSLTVDELYGVALTTSGIMDVSSQTLRFNSQAPTWGTNIDLLRHLKVIFGDIPVYLLENAGKACGRAVLSEKPEYLQKRILTVFTTWGISACLMERGHVLSGTDSLIGEIGHMIISDSSQLPCGCGKHGCLESMANLGHMRRLMDEADPYTDHSQLTFPRLFDLSRQENDTARRVVRSLAHCFAVALHNLSLSYNQEAVIFQGDYGHADAFFDMCLKRELSEFRYYPKEKPFAISYDDRSLAELASRGAAEMLKKQYFSSLD